MLCSKIEEAIRVRVATVPSKFPIIAEAESTSESEIKLMSANDRRALVPGGRG